MVQADNTQTKTVQQPFAIWGLVKVGGSVVQGAKVSLVNLDDGTGHMPVPVENVNMFYTNGAGEYLIDLANITTAYAHNDTVRVMCEVEGITDYSDVNIHDTEGHKEVNFTLTRLSSLEDGIKTSALPRQTGSLKRGLVQGLTDGME